MADFATVAELELVMATSGLGARGTAILGYASAEIRRFCRQDLEATSGRQEEFAGGQGRSILTLTQHPVTAVSAITVDAVAFTAFVWNHWGDIHKTDWSTWDEGPILVTYDSGYAAASDEMQAVESICIEVAARALGGSQAGEFGTFGNEVSELRGAAPGIFLTPGEEARLQDLGAVMVG